METFSTLLALREGNPLVTVGFPSQRPLTWSFDVFFELLNLKSWANNGDASDFWCHHTHYDATLMKSFWVNDTLISLFWKTKQFYHLISFVLILSHFTLSSPLICIPITPNKPWTQKKTFANFLTPFYCGTWLTLKHRETHGCVVSTVATDALVLKHQAISILSTD